jgi:hypothetical protein
LTAPAAGHVSRLLDLHDVFFFGLGRGVDLGHIAVGDLLDFLGHFLVFEQKRIALSMKALEAAPPEPKRKNFKPAPPPKPSFNDAVAALADKFKRR